MNVIDEAGLRLKDLPGPGDYREKTPLAEAKHKLGRFNRADKLLTPADAAKKLPFISAMASMSEGSATLNPNVFASVCPSESGLPAYEKAGPEFSFGKARRPW